jgi:hypothetical protein
MHAAVVVLAARAVPAVAGRLTLRRVLRSLADAQANRPRWFFKSATLFAGIAILRNNVLGAGTSMRAALARRCASPRCVSAPTSLRLKGTACEAASLLARQ